MSSFLRGLHSGRVLPLLAVAFAVGAVSMWLDKGQPWLPLSMVVVFALPLYAAQVHYHVRLSAVTKDSPYFLGFSFTLFALITVFRHLAAQRSSGDVEGLLFRGAASALLTTIAGLACRQTLYSTDPLEEGADDLLQQLTENLRDNAKELVRAQSELMALMQEFSEVREGALKEEEKVAKRYRRTLGSLAEELEVLAASTSVVIRDRIRNLSDGTAEATSELTGVLEMLRSQHESLAGFGEKQVARLGGLAEQYERQAAAVQTSASRALEEMTSGATELGTHLRASGQSLSAAATRLAEPIIALGAAVTDVRSHVDNVADALAILPTRIDEAARGLTQLPTASRLAGEAIAGLPAEIERSAQHLVRAAAGVESRVDERLNETIRDLQAIDALVDQVVDVLNSKLSSLASIDGRHA